MEQSQIQPLLQRYQDGLCTPEEAAAVEQWYETLGNERAEPMLTAQEQANLQTTMWANIAPQKQVAETPVRQLHPQRQAARWWQWAAAAMLVLGCGLGVLLFRTGQLNHSATVAATTSRAAQVAADTLSEWVEQANNTRQVAKISLQDGSVVSLSPASQLRYPRQFRGNRRQVQLRGEAFFEISHNPARPFQVFTDKLVTTVLGTSFRVRAYAGHAQAQVQVRTGRVRVTPLAGSTTNKALPAPVVVLPNQQVAYSPQASRLVAELVARPVVVVVQTQPQVFDDRPVAEVMAALEKAYGVDILFDRTALANCTVSLRFRNEPLFDKLSVLCKTLNGTYKVVGTQVIFQAKGCPKD